MASTSKLKGAKDKGLLRNLIWAIIFIFALMLFIPLLLNVITRHNREIAVPDFTGLTVEEAESFARSNKVRMDVTDSVYVSHLPLGTVFSQNPRVGDKVKKGRRILITINATQPKTVAMPRLVGLSLRGAKAEIASRGLTIGKLTYVPDMATNYVLSQKIKGRNVAPGKKITAETPIDLTLGVNAGESTTYIPYLIGHTKDMAKEMLIDNSLNLGLVSFDESVESYADSLQAQVYSQSPAYSRGGFPLGTKVSIYLTIDPSKISAAAPAADTTAIDE